MNLDNEQGPRLTLADLERVIRLVKSVYYVTSQWCPKVDDEGKECACRLKDPGYYIVHPDLLPKFKAMVEATGMIAEPYDFG